MIYYINGEFVPKEQAVLQVNDLGLLRGYASFDFLRVIEQVPLFLSDYLDRFFHSSSKMNLHCPCNRQEVTAIIYRLIEMNPPGRSGIRLILTGGFSEGNYLPSDKTNFIILHEPFDTAAEEIYAKGIAVKTVEFQRPLPEVKSTDYFMGIAQQLSMSNGFQDVLYYSHGQVRELPRSNIFMLNRQGQLLTPKTKILEGITRKRLLEMHIDSCEVIARDFDLAALLDEAVELFLSSSTKGILGIVRVDDKMIGNGKPGTLTVALRKKLLNQEDAFIQQHTKTLPLS